MSTTLSNNQPDTSPASTWIVRQNRLARALENAHLPALVLNPGPSLKHLTGLQFHLMERPVVAFFVPGQPVILVIPELEAAKIAALPFPTRVFLYGEDPATWPFVFRQAAQAAEIEGNVGVEPTRLRFLELRLIQAAAPEVNFISAEKSLTDLRVRKDVEELAQMRRAVEIAQHALNNTLPTIRKGMTERQVAAELTLQLLRAGSDPEMPFSPIVSAGPNSANPHASPSDRALAQGDLLVIDWGAYYEGYCSDLTRTFAIGEIDPEFRKIAKIVKESNEAGRAAAAPGVPAGQVDSAARAVIEKSGYGVYFTHRTGHGIGMEGHEEPYIRSGNPLLLEPGMTFTVEPGIYLPNRNGVRIEDNIIITEDRSETLSSLPRELISLGE
jgi:Xaa-Pro dipeptidase